MKCRCCNHEVDQLVLDLGTSPPSNAYLEEADLARPETYFPLRIYVCNNCWMLQTEDYAESDALFTPDYAYFSSTSKSWLEHAKQYCDKMRERLALNEDSFVVELASNDGYLLKNFVAANIPCLGIEPTASTAKAAEEVGVPTLQEFFGEVLGEKLSAEGKQADLILGNNVYAHVPDINDFTLGIKRLLKSGGTVTLEFPHVMELMKHGQFDTVYHEHYSYLSLGVVRQIFDNAGLRVCDVEKLPTHGGSLRVYGCHKDDGREDAKAVAALLTEEQDFGLETRELYADFQLRSEAIKDDLLNFLIRVKKEGKKIVAYGAAAKGNTLLNFAGVQRDLLPRVYDAAEAKQGKFMPGSRIPILPPQEMEGERPDYILILPWNIADEIRAKYQNLHQDGVKFVTAIPNLQVS